MMPLSRRNFLQKGLLASAFAGLASKAVAGSISQAPTLPSPPVDAPSQAKPVVLLLGGGHKDVYLKRVSGLLAEKATIVSPEGSTGNTLHILCHLEGWLKTYSPDVVHLSTGFEDVRSLYYGTYEARVPRSFYKRNVREILEVIFSFSDKAIPIWQTTTPVIDDKLIDDKNKVRDCTFFNDDIIAYNKDAEKICRRMKVPIVDLHMVIARAGTDAHLTGNGYDLNGKGLAAISKAIAEHTELYL